MQRSTSKKILTTHVGSLPRPNGTDRPGGEDDAELRRMVADVVARQRETGIDVINEGEYTKGGDWLSYVDDRFSGFEARPPAGGKPIILQGKDREVFADFYRSATERGTLFYEPAGQIKQSRPHWVASGPISYRGEASLRREIDIFRSVIGPRHGSLHHHHGPGKPGALSWQRVLPQPGRIHLRPRRSDAQRVSGNRHRRFHPAGR